MKKYCLSSEKGLSKEDRARCRFWKEFSPERGTEFRSAEHPNQPMFHKLLTEFSQHFKVNIPLKSSALQ
jgi:hypothetical protein